MTSIAETTASATVAGLSDTEWTRLASKRVFFGHQSVGANILEGLRELAAEAGAPLRIVRSIHPASIDGPALIESPIGSNGDPSSKSRAFAAALDNGMGADGGIALYKYCYLDFGPASDAEAIFADYRRGVDSLMLRYPNLTIVHVTVPLTTVEGTAKRLVKGLLGRPTAVDANATRNAFNTMLRNAYGSSPAFFDLAALESTDAQGRRSFLVHHRDTVYTLSADWTEDGGHLNAVGKRRAAAAFLKVIAGL